MVCTRGKDCDSSREKRHIVVYSFSFLDENDFERSHYQLFSFNMSSHRCAGWKDTPITRRLGFSAQTPEETIKLLCRLHIIRLRNGYSEAGVHVDPMMCVYDVTLDFLPDRKDKASTSAETEHSL